MWEADVIGVSIEEQPKESLMNELLKLAESRTVKSFKKRILEVLTKNPKLLVEIAMDLYLKLEQRHLLRASVEDIVSSLLHVDLNNPLSLIGAKSAILEM